MANRSVEVSDWAIEFATSRLLSTEDGRPARDYLTGERGVGEAVIREYGVGLYEPQRLRAHLIDCGFSVEEIAGSQIIRPSFHGWLHFPWRDDDGVPRGYVFRALPWSKVGSDKLGRRMKYAFCGDRDRLPLYGLARALAFGHRRLIAVEGTIDVLALNSAGIDDVVAINSCQLRVWHAADLRRKGVQGLVLMLDGDVPGRRGTLRSIEACHAAGLDVVVAEPAGDELDPDELVLRNGAGAFRAQVAAASDGYAVFAEHLLDTYQLAGGGEAARRAGITAAADFHALRAPGRPDDDVWARFWPLLAPVFRLDERQLRGEVDAAYRRHLDMRSARGLRPVVRATA